MLLLSPKLAVNYKCLVEFSRRHVQALKLSVSMRSRERPFWQAHYYDFNVSTHDKFVEKLRYIHRKHGVPGARTSCAGV
jgi:hypothetical protein